METINTVELRDQEIYPNETILKKVLGRSYNAFQECLKLYDENDMTHEWRYTMMEKHGFAKFRKRNGLLFGCQPGRDICRLVFICH